MERVNLRIDTKSVRYGAFILTAANICSQILGFIYRIALSRLIGAEGMGLFQLVYPFYSLSLTIATSGICVAVSRLSAEYAALGNYLAVRLLIRRAVVVFFMIFLSLSVLVFLFVDVIAVHFLGDERTKLAIFAMIPVIFFTGIENIHKNFFYGTKNVNPPALSDLLEQIIRMGAVLLLLYFLLPRPDEQMLVIIVTGMLICEIFSSTFLRAIYVKKIRKMPAGGEKDPHMTSKLGKIAVPISFTSLCNNLLSSLIIIIIPRRLVLTGMTQSEALSTFGVLFGMTIPLLNLPSALIVGLGLVMVPKLSENLALGNYNDLRSKISRAITTTSMFVLPAVAVMVPLGPQLGMILFRQAAEERFLLPLAVGTVFAIYMVILGNILNGLGKQIKSAANFLVGNLLELAITYYFTAVPWIGIYGYVIASISTTFLTFMLNLYAVSKVAKLKIQWERWFIVPALSAVLAALCARLVFLHAEQTFGGGTALVMALIIAAAVYLGVVAFQGTFSKGTATAKV